MLQVFKSLPVVRDLYHADELPLGSEGYTRDTITLGWEDRLRGRARRRSDGGLEFGTALPTGTVLRQGDCFVVDGALTVVAVLERDEAVFVVHPASPLEWGLFAYHIGNSHQPLMIAEEGLICPDVPGVEQVLEYHGIPFSRALRTFTPVALSVDHRHGLV